MERLFEKELGITLRAAVVPQMGALSPKDVQAEDAALNALPEGYVMSGREIAEYTALYRARMTAAFRNPKKYDAVHNDLLRFGVLMDGKHPVGTRTTEFDDDDGDDSLTLDRWADANHGLDDHYDFVDAERRWALGIMRQRREAEDRPAAHHDIRNDRRAYAGGAREARKAGRRIKQSNAGASKVK
ncbi:hypothetical protein KBD59_05335 [Candidatus Gracilibacteria bacterium]|nr:hypothetical protein [Candidatus Gracilibacteria bacterium]